MRLTPSLGTVLIGAPSSNKLPVTACVRLLLSLSPPVVRISLDKALPPGPDQGHNASPAAQRATFATLDLGFSLADLESFMRRGIGPAGPDELSDFLGQPHWQEIIGVQESVCLPTADTTHLVTDGFPLPRHARMALRAAPAGRGLSFQIGTGFLGPFPGQFRSGIWLLNLSRHMLPNVMR